MTAAASVKRVYQSLSNQRLQKGSLKPPGPDGGGAFFDTVFDTVLETVLAGGESSRLGSWIDDGSN